MEKGRKLYLLLEDILHGKGIEDLFSNSEVLNFFDAGEQFHLYHLYDEKYIAGKVYHLSLLRRDKQHENAYMEILFDPTQKTVDIEFYQDGKYQLHYENEADRKGEDYDDLRLIAHNWFLALQAHDRRKVSDPEGRNVIQENIGSPMVA